MKKILFIEDDTEMQKIYAEAFSNESIETIPAYTVDSGLQLANTHKPDLIILDIMLPGGKNGFDALEILVKDEDLKKIPVLILSNLDSEKKVALEIGAKDYLVKANTSIDQVVAKVKELLGEK